MKNGRRSYRLRPLSKWRQTWEMPATRQPQVTFVWETSSDGLADRMLLVQSDSVSHEVRRAVSGVTWSFARPRSVFAPRTISPISQDQISHLMVKLWILTAQKRSVHASCVSQRDSDRSDLLQDVTTTIDYFAIAEWPTECNNTFRSTCWQSPSMPGIGNNPNTGLRYPHPLPAGSFRRPTLQTTYQDGMAPRHRSTRYRSLGDKLPI